MKKLTEKDLVSFGNYLLSDKRRDLFKAHPVKGVPLKERLSQVHDADLRN